MIALFQFPVLYVPEYAHAVMTEDRILCDAFDLLVAYIVYIHIAEECISRVFNHRFLELCIILLSFSPVAGLAGFCQRFVNGLVAVSAVVVALVCAKHFVCMIVCVKRAAPSDEESLLVFPVDLGFDFVLRVDSDVFELLAGNCSEVCSDLIAFFAVYRK